MQTKLMSEYYGTDDLVVNGRPTRDFSISYLKIILGENYDKIPEGTKYKLYEGRIPVAYIPLPNGGAICLAFDTHVPRGFPIGSFEKSDTITYEEFREMRYIRHI